VMGLLFMASFSYANEPLAFYGQFQYLHISRSQIEMKLAISQEFDTYPHATCYYDDLEDHYEQDQMMRDSIDDAIR